MRNIKKSILAAALAAAALVSLISCSSATDSFSPAADSDKKIDIPYAYPITQKDTEWRSLFTLKDMIAACEVPDEVLKKMTTRALAETVLDYPLLLNMLAYDTMQMGFESVLSYCNSLQELTKRSDAVGELESLAAKLNAGGILDGGTIAPERIEIVTRYGYCILISSQIEAMRKGTFGNKTPLDLWHAQMKDIREA